MLVLSARCRSDGNGMRMSVKDSKVLIKICSVQYLLYISVLVLSLRGVTNFRSAFGPALVQ